jgi:hypothetical protein
VFGLRQYEATTTSLHGSARRVERFNHFKNDAVTMEQAACIRDPLRLQR